ncbi:hypothetical protein D9613_009992 [Agrocybe pediades]|uniref:Uncharacterized protein n=1 Tax=Agrocybe pediades TaxID=84607 RepID=A0A8H4VPU6_9AGAR|nr:hypothetical protein D9613_009992 [Agrocybe pediades]
MPSISDTLATPLSLYAIPAMWIISLYPAFARVSTFNEVFQLERNVNESLKWLPDDSSAESRSVRQPRVSYASVAQKKTIPPAVAARIQRLEGAHANGLENLPIFGLAVLAGNFAQMDSANLNIACGFYLLTRLAYNHFYARQYDEKSADIRSLTWVISLASPLYIFFKSASLLAQKYP